MEDLNAATPSSPPREKVDVPGQFSEEFRAKSIGFPRKKDRVFFTASASAQDLRDLDVEKEVEEAMEAASPCGVLEDGLRSSDSETGTSKASTSYSGGPGTTSNTSLWRGLMKLWRKKSMRRLYSFPPSRAPKPSRRRNKEEENPGEKCGYQSDFCFKPSWKCFSQLELENATNNFSPDNIIGRGGYAEVFKGCLEDGQLVAIKRLTRGTSDERTIDFLSELGIIVHINHPNAAKLVGVGAEGGMHLVLELSTNGSLENLLYGSKSNLDWAERYKIVLGTAEGLEYLHERCQRRIIHRDIKAANILLTEDFKPQICDFGLAKWLPDKLTYHTVSTIEGTFGYLAPEYFMHGIVDEKTDVFAFGVLVLELISGRKAIDSTQQSLVMWARPILEKNHFKDLVDPFLGDAYDFKQLKIAAQTALLCIQHSSVLRPCMSQVLKLLKGEYGTSFIKVRQKLHRTYSEEIFDAEEYNATRYLSDLTRHKHVALES